MFAGEHVEARDQLERALAIFQPGRDDDLVFRFGQDAGVATMLYLALTLWQLGDIGRAVSLVDDAEARITSLTHTATRAYGKCHLAMFALMHGDLSRAAQNAVELAPLTREHDLPLWRAFGSFSKASQPLKAGRAAGSTQCVMARNSYANKTY